jgi:hypothetical protein
MTQVSLLWHHPERVPALAAKATYTGAHIGRFRRSTSAHADAVTL